MGLRRRRLGHHDAGPTTAYYLVQLVTTTFTFPFGVIFGFGKWDSVLSLVLAVQWVLGGIIAPSVFVPDRMRWTLRLSSLWSGGGGVAVGMQG